MGRLNLTRRKVRRLVTAWALPLLLSLGVLFGVHSFATADTAPTTDELKSYLQTNQLEVGTDTVDGYQQIYYMWKGSRVFMTAANYSHIKPVASGEYVAWEGQLNGAGQIFLYDVVTQTLTQVTSAGTNQNPSIYNNMVMWESWDTDHWVVYCYDGIGVYQLTSSGYSAVRPKSDGKQIVFAELQPDGWEAWSYDLTSGQYTLLKTGDESSTAYPHFGPDGSVRTAIHD